MRALEIALNQPKRQTRVWRQQAGTVEAMNPHRWIHCAPAGAADLTGEVAPYGLRLEIETKGASGRQHKAQRDWQARCSRAGTVYVVVRDLAGVPLDVSVAAAVAAVDGAIGRALERLRGMLATAGEGCVELARAVLNGTARRDDVEDLARLVLVRELPPLFDCGCSKHKVTLGFCDVYGPDGLLRQPEARCS